MAALFLVCAQQRRHAIPRLAAHVCRARQNDEVRCIQAALSRLTTRRHRSKSTYSQQSQRGFLCLPHALVAPLLGPFSSVLLPQAPAKSPTTAAPPKKPRLASRLFQMCYVLFSLAYLTAHLLGYTPVRGHTAAQDAKRLVPRQSEAADQVIIGGWAQGLAKGLKAKMPARLGYGQDSETSPSTAVDAMEKTAQETAAPVAAVPVNAVTQKWST
jgi:hypothetical protein